MIWHNADCNDVLSELEVDPEKGLPTGMADIRTEEFGANTLGSTNRKTFMRCVASQFKNAYIIALSVTAAVYFILTFFSELGHWWEPLIIVAVLIISALVAAFQEFRAINTLAVLSDMSSPVSEILRDGIVKRLPSDCIVPGDIIILNTGDYIPADGRIISANELRCDESVLTGETVAVEKDSTLIFEDIAPVATRANMVFCGCHVLHGNAKIVVTQTGTSTELGRQAIIQKQSGEAKSPVMSKLYGLGKIFSIICAVVCVIYFILSVLLKLSSTDLPFTSLIIKNIMIALALAVAAVPETLTAVGTVVLALGINRMTNGNVIVKRLRSLERLSGISVICTDKTGILTENIMTVSKLYDGEKVVNLETDAPGENDRLLLKLLLMCTALSDHEEFDKNQIDNAIFKAGIKYLNMTKANCDNVFPQLSGIPFDPVRKLMSSINMIDGKPLVIVKGAPEIVFEKCSGNYDDFSKINDQFTAESLHVLCIAVKPLDEIPANPSAQQLESDLNVVGLIAMNDPLQNDALDSVAACDTAGIRTVLLTGDNINTAGTIARRIGILKDGELAVTGAQLQEMSDEELTANIDKYSVFARVNATDKRRVVSAWKKRNETVAVTGTGIDDASALQLADIGCAMGKHSTDVAKGVSDIIVIDNRFSSITKAIMRCRGMFDNIRKSVHYLFACNFGELLGELLCVIVFRQSPLSAVALLLINLLTDCGPAISLGMQPTDRSVRNQLPQKRYMHVLNGRITILCVMQALYLAIVTMMAYALGRSGGAGVSETMAFTALLLSQLAVSLNISSDRSLFTGCFLKNRHLLFSVFVGAAVTLILVLTPVASLFSFTVLTGAQLAKTLLFAAMTLLIGEIYKLVRHIWDNKN